MQNHIRRIAIKGRITAVTVPTALIFRNNISSIIFLPRDLYINAANPRPEIIRLATTKAILLTFLTIFLSLTLQPAR